jgi:hypothetical protein
MISSTQFILDDLVDLLQKIDNSDYKQPCPQLSESTIGQHTRHIIEMFICLIEGYKEGQVNYDARKRDKSIETDTRTAIEKIRWIQYHIDKPDKPFVNKVQIDNVEIGIQSSYLRELFYNQEHCTHHQALIKVGLYNLENISVSNEFGVASSTLKYRKAQTQ